ncbi:hypothetical protein V9K67_15710 [Paraflavisolibacter sp. H34]|uniref:hypothetical protein n=1 Tax=Huijunlia imazamoxiresistens TaxID=3127457 RepID=UPI0030196108
MQLQLCSGAVVKLWYAPAGVFQRSNESFAVVNEALEPVREVRVEEGAQARTFYYSFGCSLQLLTPGFPLAPIQFYSPPICIP